MHSQEQIQLLLENPIVQELLEILENEGKAVLQHLEFSYINQLFEQRKKTKKGRPRTYPPSNNLRALLYGLAEGKHTLRGISRTIRTSVAQVFLGLDDGMSYATLNRFWHKFATVAESVFKELAQMIAGLGIIGGVHAVDSTSISTPYLDDADAVWRCDSTKGEILLRLWSATRSRHADVSKEEQFESRNVSYPHNNFHPDALDTLRSMGEILEFLIVNNMIVRILTGWE